MSLNTCNIFLCLIIQLIVNLHFLGEKRQEENCHCPALIHHLHSVTQKSIELILQNQVNKLFHLDRIDSSESGRQIIPFR